MADDVVIVGMACRYAEADDPEQLWENVLSQRRSFRPMPSQRLPVAEYGGDGSDQVYLTHAAVLADWQFDRREFRVPGDTFRAVDLTHWLALEVSAAALRDAGLPDGDGLDRSRVGVVVGNSLTGEFSRAATLRTRWPYVRRVVAAALSGSSLPPAEQANLLATVERDFKAPFPAPSDETLSGALANTIAGRICNYFDFRGAGYTVDGACASSLLAVATAAAAVADGQWEVALAGGVDLSLDPFELVGFSRLGALATGEMRVYDRRPTGFLPGEGCGVVVLCRESYARRRGLRPYARLLGWGTSSDGNGGLTRPEQAGQELALTRAYQRAGLSPADVSLVEGHGTGTEVGDATELRALLAVRGAAAGKAVLGSVKANLGHTKAAAGVAGVIKAVLALHREVLPPTTGCVEPHPALADPHSTLEVTDTARPWPAGQRYASVSAMGFGGINAHAVLAGVATTARRALSRHESRLAGRQPDYELVVCAAESTERLADRLRELETAAAAMSRGELSDLAATLAGTERASAPARFAAAVRDPAQLAAAVRHGLARLAGGESLVLDRRRRVFLASGSRLRVGLLFSGQASPCYPHAGALGDLLDELPAGYRDRLALPDAGPADTAVAQPAVLRASLAGLSWLDAIGVRATHAVGHSLGEFAALVWAGALTADEAYELVRERAAAMAAASGEPAAMASLATDLATATRLGSGTGAVVAADNAADQVVVSGTRAQVTAVADRAHQAGIRVTWLPVVQAFHSPLMAAAADRLRAAARQVKWRPPSAPLASTITGDWWRDDHDPVELVVRQLTSPVRFREAQARLEAELLIEVGPGSILSDLVGDRAVPLDAGASSAEGIAVSTAALFAAGAVDSVEPYFARRFARQFRLGQSREFLRNPCEIDPPAVPELPWGSSVAGSSAVGGAAMDGAVGGTGAAGGAAEGPAGSQVADGLAVKGQSVDHQPGPVEPLDATVNRLAALLELDAAAIASDARLLADLHLTSLRVTQLVGQVAADLGRAQPTQALSVASATVAELAEAVAQLPPAIDEPGPVDGVEPWVRAFQPRLVARPVRESMMDDVAAGPAGWEIVGDLADHPLAAAVRDAFPPLPPAPDRHPRHSADLGLVQPGMPDSSLNNSEIDESGSARLLALAPGLSSDHSGAIVAALRESLHDHRPLLVLHHGGLGGAVGRSLAVEAPKAPVLVVETPPDADGVRLAAAEAARGWQGYTELVYDADRVRTTPVLRPLPVDRPGELPLSAGELCLVTGGASGIGLECALALASATGAQLALLGRRPDTDEQVASALARCEAAAVVATYYRADVADPAAVAETIARIQASGGPVRGLLHAAGRNDPRGIAELTEDDLRAALAPKAYGLEHVLAALDPAALRLAVTFGSVIGRTGLPGEAAYALANEWLARRCAELAEDWPGVRWLNIEWSAWSGTGMGERLGVLADLRRQGLTPIPVEQGVDWLLRLLATPSLPTTVVVAGRLPALATLHWDDGGERYGGEERPGGAELPGGRFLADRLSHTPGVELVAQSAVSLGTDPYLADHRIDGTPVLPAVFGLEAMAQVCAALNATPVPASYRDVSLSRPVTVPERGSRALRLAGLTGVDGSVEVVARSDETGFGADHFRAVRVDPDPPALTESPEPHQPSLDGTELYGPVFFHGTRFQRVRGYHRIGAYRCLAVIEADPRAGWFGGFLSRHLQLGDPGARDAFLHALQVCVPDRRVLPVAVERVTVYRRPSGRLLLDARQRAEGRDDFVFDLIVRDDSGSVVERWEGLAMRAVGPLPGRWPVATVGAYLTRTLRRWLPGIDVDLLVVPADATAPPGVVATRRLGDQSLAAGIGPAAVEWRWVGSEPPDFGSPTTADGWVRLVADLAARADEPVASAATRVRLCREVLVRCRGSDDPSSITVDEVGPAGWIRLTSGELQLFTTVVETTAGALAAGLAITADRVEMVDG